MTKHLVNVSIDFMDGQHANAGDTVELDPTKVTDIADLQATIYEGQPVLGPAIVEPTPDVTPKSARAQKAPDVPPAQEVTTSEQS